MDLIPWQQPESALRTVLKVKNKGLLTSPDVTVGLIHIFSPNLTMVLWGRLYSHFLKNNKGALKRFGTGLSQDLTDFRH